MAPPTAPAGAAPPPAGAGSGLIVKLHPLVLINISDHHTRVRAQQADGAAVSSAAAPPPRVRVVGCLLGVQSGRTVELFNSFEAKFGPEAGGDGGAITLDDAFLRQKQEQCARHVGRQLDGGEGGSMPSKITSLSPRH